MEQSKNPELPPFSVHHEFWGIIAENPDGTRIFGFENISQGRPRGFAVDGVGGCFGYVDRGTLDIYGSHLDGKAFRQRVEAGQWFSTPTEFFGNYSSGLFRCAVFQKLDYFGTLTIGHVEAEGRLNYIDGAKDTILHSPIVKGEPCLNALYMPQGIHQTMHTHPSTRAGFIIHGGGAICETPDGIFELTDGSIFYLKPDAEHKFRTDLYQRASLKLVAFHPDSDFGPTNEEHPMLNRTMVEGISAKDIPEIQTGNTQHAKAQ